MVIKVLVLVEVLNNIITTEEHFVSEENHSTLKMQSPDYSLCFSDLEIVGHPFILTERKLLTLQNILEDSSLLLSSSPEGLQTATMTLVSKLTQRRQKC